MINGTANFSCMANILCLSVRGKNANTIYIIRSHAAGVCRIKLNNKPANVHI